MEFYFKAPAKTFLLGEYFVMSSGSSLVLCTQPYFEMRVSPGEGFVKGIHSKSPAGLWIQGHEKDFLNLNLEYKDPHKGKGGWGSSSSQFLFVCLWSWMKNCKGLPTPQFLWELYQETLEWGRDVGKGVKEETGEEAGGQVRKKRKTLENKKALKEKLILNGSGADLAAQWQGGISEFSPSPFFLRRWTWPFKGFDFMIVSTGYKVRTHEHLSHLKRKNFSFLKVSVKKAIRAFYKGTWGPFVDAVREFQLALSSLSLVAQNTKDFLKELEGWPEIDAAKGCGALGADAFILFFKTSEKKILEKRLKLLNLKPFATSLHLVGGLKVGWRGEKIKKR